MDIDPNLLNIVLGLATNGITSLLAMSGRAAGNLLIGKDFREKWELEKISLAPLLHNAIEHVAEHVEWEGITREEIVSLFLLSPEAEEIVRQIYATRFASGKKSQSFSSLYQLFIASFTNFVRSYSTDIEVDEAYFAEPATILLNTLVRECDLILQSATDKGILAAHEAKSAFRHHIIRSELEAIHKKLGFLTEQAQLNLCAVLEYEKKYRDQVGKVQQHYVVDAQRTPFRSRTTGFLGTDAFFSDLVRGRPFFLGIGNGGGATLYVKSSLTLQT